MLKKFKGELVKLDCKDFEITLVLFPDSVDAQRGREGRNAVCIVGGKLDLVRISTTESREQWFVVRGSAKFGMPVSTWRREFPDRNHFELTGREVEVQIDVEDETGEEEYQGSGRIDW